MANMSYCRFENTASDLSDCVDHVLEPLRSEYERDGRIKLVKLCVEVLELLGCEVKDEEGEDVRDRGEDVERILKGYVREADGDDEDAEEQG